MSTSILTARNPLPEIPEFRSEPLDPVVERYAFDGAIAGTEWLTRLDLERPRRGLQCLSARRRIAKRMMDIFGALTLLVLTAPLMLVSALLVRLTSRGPALYCQVRTGLNLRRETDRRRGLRGPVASRDRRRQLRDRRMVRSFGRPFVMYKFRSMRIDAEKDGARFAQAADSRVTRVGRFLRRTRIDELPQLWNVLKGEMSLVGPRPERPEFIAGLSAEIPNYVSRLGLKPGLTGLAQVENGYDNNLEGFRRKVAYDLLYLQNCCLRNDLKILLRTVSVVLTGKGAL